MPSLPASNAPLKKRLILLLVVPMLGLAWANGSVALSKRADISEANDTDRLVEVAVDSGQVLHEIQKERGLTALFLSSDQSDNAALLTQRLATDEAWRKIEAFLANVQDALPADARTKTLEMEEAIGGIGGLRASVDSGSIELSAAIATYTGMNNSLLNLVAELGTSSSAAEITRATANYSALLSGKEKAGIIRAQLANVFSHDEFSPGQRTTVVSLIAEQRTYFDVFRRSASPALLSSFEQASQSPAAQDVNEFELTALGDGGGPFGVDPQEWFATMTARIDALKTIEDHQAVEIQQLSAELSSSASAGFRNALIMLIGFSLVTAVLAHLSIQAITRTLSGHADDLTSTSVALGGTADQISQVVSLAAETAGEASGAADEVSDNVANVATAVEELAQAVTEISVNTSRASQVAANAVEQAATTNSTVTQLGVSSEQIGAVVEVISGIAEQTNLLALNATIEAARAGESGKGFAVVANEVKELAQQTNTSTEEIGKLVTAIQGDSNRSAQAIQEIGDIIQEIAEIQTSIAAAVEEQSATTGEISRNIVAAADGSNEIALSIRAVADQANEAQDDVATTIEAARDLQEVAGSIQAMAGSSK